MGVVVDTSVWIGGEGARATDGRLPERDSNPSGGGGRPGQAGCVAGARGDWRCLASPASASRL